MIEENNKKLTFEQLDTVVGGTVVGGVGKIKSEFLSFGLGLASIGTIFLLSILEAKKHRHDQQRKQTCCSLFKPN